MSATVHLVKGMHDVVMRPTELWCDGVEYEREAGWADSWTESIDRATCRHCLQEASEYGAEARLRLLAITASNLILKLPAPSSNSDAIETRITTPVWYCRVCEAYVADPENHRFHAVVRE